MKKEIMVNLMWMTEGMTFHRRKQKTEEIWKIKPDYLEGLRKITESTGAELIVANDWREHFSDSGTPCTEIGAFLQKQLDEYGLSFGGKTYRSANGRSMSGIEYRINEHPEVISYLLLVDDPYSAADRTRTVFVDSHEGFCQKHIERAVELLNGAQTMERDPHFREHYQIVCRDFVLYLDENERAMEEKYAGRFFYKAVCGCDGIKAIRIDKIELSPEFRAIRETVEQKVAARMKRTWDPDSFDESLQIPDYACACDKNHIYLANKKALLREAGIEWLSYDDLNY